MTEIVIDGFQGLSVRFELGRPLTWIAGANGAGKTRIARALGAVLSSTTMPLSGKKGDFRGCLTNGEGRASVVLRDGDAFRAMIWTDGRCEPSVKGPQDDLPRSSKYAAGLVSLLRLTGKDRAAGFAEVFRTQPTANDLRKAFKEAGLPDALVDSYWDKIDVNGWDAIADDAAKEARTLKGRWNEVTGASWGERVAETWEPDSKHFPDPDVLKEELRLAEEELDHANKRLETAKAERAKLPQRVEEFSSHACPWCEKPVTVKFGRIEKVEQESPTTSADIKALRGQIAEAEGRVANAQDQVYHQQRAVGSAKTRLSDAADARRKAKARADQLHDQIVEQLAIAKVCGPAGLRQEKLERVLEVVNRQLAETAREKGLPVLEISPDLDARLDGTPYGQLSTGQAWIARALMQLEVALCDHSQVVVLDDLDRLAAPADRNAILSAVLGSDLQAVIMQADWNPADLDRTPDLAAAGYGVTYWLQPVYEDVVDQETGEIVGQRVTETSMSPIAEVRSETAGQEAA